MKTLIAIVLSFVASMALAAGDNMNPTDAVPGITMGAVTILQRDQFVLHKQPAFGTFPAETLSGYGFRTIFEGTTGTHTLSPAAIVTNEGYGSAVSMWQHTTPGCTTALLLPVLRDCTVAGCSVDSQNPGVPTPDWPSGGAVNDAPYLFNRNATHLYDGAVFTGSAGTIENVNFFYIPGRACFIQRPDTNLNNSIQPFDAICWSGRHIRATRVFCGPVWAATDSSLEDVETHVFGEFGCAIGNSTSGHIFYNKIHCYGGGYGREVNGTGGAAVWMAGFDNIGGDITGANSAGGIYCSGSNNTCHGFRAFTNSFQNLHIHGQYNAYYGGDIRCDGQYIGTTANTDASTGTTVTIIGSGIDLTNVPIDGNCAIQIADPNTAHRSLSRITNITQTDSTHWSVTVSPGFATSLSGLAWGIGGSGVLISDQYNWLTDTKIAGVDRSCALQLTNGTHQVIRDLTINNFGVTNAKGIDIETALVNCRISAHILGGLTGIDFTNGGAIGASNEIDITTSNSCTNPCILPSGWQSATVKHTWSVVRINGILFYPASDEF